MKKYNPFSNRHSLIHIVSLERIDLPPKLLDGEDWSIYVDPDSSLINKKVPQEVLELFQILKSLGYKEDTVELDGWTWERSVSMHENENNYIRTKYVSSDIVLASLNPYLNKLEELAGKTVPSVELLPPFSDCEPYKFFDIPEVKQKLDFLKGKKTEEGYSTITLEILTITGSAPSGMLATTEVPIARIKYEIGVQQK